VAERADGASDCGFVLVPPSGPDDGYAQGDLVVQVFRRSILSRRKDSPPATLS
jgi:hypothetical protein